ncbi:hypothetical protein ACT7C7_29810 [Bacillus cereus]
MIPLENGKQALEISNCDTNVSQSIVLPKFKPNQSYVLRLYGKGEGDITFCTIWKKIQSASISQTHNIG